MSAGSEVAAVRVLLADGQPLVRAGIAMLLSAEPGIEAVAEAGDGEQAVARALLLRPDVVVMDLRMPGVDGVAATRRITGDGGPRVLILTALRVDADVCAALRAGASGYLLKDAAPADLVAAVRAVAAGGGWLDPAVTRAMIEEFAARPPAGAPAPAGLVRLTPRERDVLAHVARGLSNQDIAGLA